MNLEQEFKRALSKIVLLNIIFWYMSVKILKYSYNHLERFLKRLISFNKLNIYYKDYTSTLVVISALSLLLYLVSSGI